MTEAPTDKPASPPAREELYFDSLKEHPGAYFVEYQTPVAEIEPRQVPTAACVIWGLGTDP